MDLSRSNGQKNTPINANILIKISLIISHLLYFISISKPKKKRLHLNLYIFLYLFLLHHCSTSMRDSGSTQKLNSFSFHHPIIPPSPLFLTNLPQFRWISISTTDTKSFITYPHCSVLTIIRPNYISHQRYFPNSDLILSLNNALSLAMLEIHVFYFCFCFFEL